MLQMIDAAIGVLLGFAVAISVSILYSLFLTGPLAGIFLTVYKTAHLEAIYFEQHPSGQIVRSEGSPEVLVFRIAFPLLLGWLASLIYLHGYIRKSV
jgi:hypothetical protein